MAKAGRPKKGSAGLPDWFDIEQYRRMKDAAAMEWLEQLVFRCRVILALNDCLKNNDKEFKILQPALQMLRDDPIITEARLQEHRKLVIENKTVEFNPVRGEHITFNGYIDYDPVIGLTVRPSKGAGITALTLVNRGNIEPNDENGWVDGTIRQRDDGTYDFDNPPLLWCGRPVVAIDPSLKDEIIMREMREFLRELRKTEKASPSAFSKDSDFSKWYNSGLLPFFDLLIWEQMGHEFRNADFVNELSLILDQPVSSESAAIKSAQTYVQNFLNDQTLRILTAQATAESKQGGAKSGKFLVR